MPMSSPVPLARLWLAVLLGYLALGATLQELPGYVAERFQAGPLAVGITVGLSFAGIALARPLAGRAGDAGWSRAVGACGGALTAVAAAGHLLAPDLGLLLVARVVMGIGEAALFSGTLPWVLAGTPASRGGRVAGWFGLSMWGGLSAGPLLAVAAHALGGSTAVWTLVIALPAGSTALIASTRRPAGPPRPLSLRGWRDLLPAGAGRPGAILGLAAYGYGTLAALLVLFLGTGGPGGRGLGGQGLGLVVFSAAFLLTRAAGSPLADRLGGLTVARCVLLVEAAGLALLATATSGPAALIAVAVTGVGLGLIYPAATKMTLTRAAAPAAGAAVGAMTSFWDLGILAAGPAGGLVAAGAGFRPAFCAAASAAALAAVLSAVREPRPRALTASARTSRCRTRTGTQ
jgi:MFS family permease